MADKSKENGAIWTSNLMHNLIKEVTIEVGDRIQDRFYRCESCDKVKSCINGIICSDCMDKTYKELLLKTKSSKIRR